MRARAGSARCAGGMLRHARERVPLTTRLAAALHLHSARGGMDRVVRGGGRSVVGQQDCARLTLAASLMRAPPLPAADTHSLVCDSLPGVHALLRADRRLDCLPLCGAGVGAVHAQERAHGHPGRPVTSVPRALVVHACADHAVARLGCHTRACVSYGVRQRRSSGVLCARAALISRTDIPSAGRRATPVLLGSPCPPSCHARRVFSRVSA